MVKNHLFSSKRFIYSMIQSTQKEKRLMENSVFYCQNKKGLEGNGWAFRKNTAQILWFSFDSKID